jgi:hypothetical protein
MSAFASLLERHLLCLWTRKQSSGMHGLRKFSRQVFPLDSGGLEQVVSAIRCSLRRSCGRNVGDLDEEVDEVEDVDLWRCLVETQMELMGSGDDLLC